MENNKISTSETVNYGQFTEDDITSCWSIYHVYYFMEVLNGNYDLEHARKDLKSLIGSKHDPRALRYK